MTAFCPVCTQKHDTELGSLRLNVEEIARNKTMKDVWPLQNANKGDIELTLTFQPIIFEEDEAVRACRRLRSCAAASLLSAIWQIINPVHLTCPWVAHACSQHECESLCSTARAGHRSMAASGVSCSSIGRHC